MIIAFGVLEGEILLSGDCEEGIFYSGDIASKLSRLKDSLQEVVES